MSHSFEEASQGRRCSSCCPQCRKLTVGDIIATDPNLGYIANRNPNAQFFNLNSLFFACSSTGSAGLYPSSCTLQVVERTMSQVADVVTSNYTYVGGPNKRAMKKVQLDGGGQFLYFSVINGPGSTTLYLDDLQVVRQCPS